MNKFYLILFVPLFLLLSGCDDYLKPGNKHFSHKRKQQNSDTTESTINYEKCVIKMEKVNGVFEIPTEIDDIPMHFIFDTGAGLISISETEANFLYKQGKLSEEDILGKAKFTDAIGNISEGTIINLKKVKIGNRLLNDVKASVVHNMNAPLLMGQSALEKLGKISINYQLGEITME